MNVLQIIIVIIAVPLIWWVSTIKLIKTPAGQTLLIGEFDKPVRVVGNTLPDLPIPSDLLPIGFNPIRVRVDSESSWQLTIWPQQVLSFTYRHKRFKTLKMIRETNGEIVWQPTLPKGEDGKLLLEKNADETIGLGEWKEENKQSLYVREREHIALKFASKDPIRGIIKAYIKFIVYDLTLAAKSVLNPKEDAEKAIIDLFQLWARDKDYFEKIQGVSFDSIDYLGKTGKDFIQGINKDIYKAGIIVEGVDFFEFIIEPDSQDVYDAKEKIAKQTSLKAAASVEADIEKIKGQGKRDYDLALNEAAKDLLEKQKAVKVSEDKDLKKNATDQFKEQTEITLVANGKIIDKAIELKQTVNATEKLKYTAIQLSKLQTLVLSGGSGTDLDEKIQAQLTANLITNKKGGSDGSK